MLELSQITYLEGVCMLYPIQHFMYQWHLTTFASSIINAALCRHIAGTELGSTAEANLLSVFLWLKTVVTFLAEDQSGM